ncbi:MAG TPA: MFS transporter [Sphingomonas sp.]|nr:MFS transporter [Sphingomonas sp.]
MGETSAESEVALARWIVPALSAAAFLAYFDRYLPAAGATLIKRELALSDAAFGLAATTMFAIAYAATSAVTGLAPQRARRWTIAAGLALWTVGSAALAFVASLEGFIAAEIAIGIGQGCVLPAAVTMLAGARGMGRIGRSTSSFTVGSTLGRASSVLVAGLLIGWLATGASGWLDRPWRAVFLLTALPNVLLLGWIALRGRDAIAAPAPTPAQDEGGTAGARTIAGLFVAASAAVLVLQAIGVWFPTLMVRCYGLTPQGAAIATGVVTLIAAPAGQALGGRLIDARPALRAAPTGLVTGALSIACVALTLLTLTPGVAASLVVLGVVDLLLGVAALAPLAGLQAQTRGTGRARATGLFFAAITVTGYGIGPLVVGAISDTAPTSATGLARALALATGSAALLAGGAHLATRRGRRATGGET